MFLRNRKILTAILVAFTLLIVAAGGYGYSIWRQVNNTGGLALFIQDKLSHHAEGVIGSIEKAELEFSLSALPVRLKASNVRLNASDTVVVLPQSEFRFSLINILLGELNPTEMRLSGLEIEIEQGSKGWHAGPSMKLLTALIDEADAASGGGPLASIRSLYIDDAKLRVMPDPDSARADGAEPTEIEPISIVLNKKGNIFVGRIDASDVMGGKIGIDFTGNPADAGLNFSVILSDINATDIYPYLGIDIPEISTLGTVTGALSLTVKDRRLEQVSGNLASTDGKAALPGYSEVDFTRANIIFSHDLALDTLLINELVLVTRNFPDHPGGELTISGQVRDLTQLMPTALIEVKGSNFSFARILELWPEGAESALRRKIKQSLSGGRIDSFGVYVVGVVDRARNVFDITTLDVISDIRQVRLETQLASVDHLIGSLSAQLEVSIDSDGRFKSVIANILLQDAILLPKGSDRKIPLEGVEVRAKLEDQTIKVSRVAFDARGLGQLVMSADVDITRDWRPHRLDLEVRAEQVDTLLVSELWPDNLWPRVREWVVGHIDGGVINGLRVDGSFDLPADMPVKIISLEGEAQIANTKLTYLQTMPPLENTWAALNFEGPTLRADIESGTVEGLDAAGSRFIIRPTEAGPEADLTLIATGDFSDAITLLDHPRIDVFNPAGLQPENAAGRIDAAAGVKWLLPAGDETIKSNVDIAINATASVQDMSVDNLPYETNVSEGVMDITYLNKKLNISGRGKFNGSPGVVSFDQYADGSIEMDLALSRSKALTEMISTRTGLEVGGNTSGIVAIRGGDGVRTLELDTRLNLDEASIDIRRLGVVKLPGEKAELEARFSIMDGHIKSISDINLESDVLNVKGRASFNETGHFLGAYFDYMNWPGNDISTITVERGGDDNKLEITARAKLIDLTPLRKEESPGDGFAMKVDLTADRVVLDQTAELSGHVSINTKKDGSGNAEFSGTLFLKDKPFMTEGTLNAAFGDGKDKLTGRGLVGGVEANITLSPVEDGGNLMILESNNAGQVLKSLDILDSIRGGSLNMVIRFEPETTDSFEAEFELENFRIIEAPRAVRMMSVLSVAGLYSLLEGDGTLFDRGHARIEAMPGRQIIHQARASGNAVAVDLIGVVDTEAEELEVSGLLLPLYGITKIIGNIPIVREIITGAENEGIFVTQFNISGPISEPENNVNLSSIVPGVFRDVFSPNWIIKERERLIGDSQPDSNTSSGQ